uniref:Uncharacterized protein n=1 Tax=Tanacetum cinerariifolium TaxID=118510 RepID=A0A699HL74_TANCI|nr:hypothetical protein [Tanacetum cinerariifolium]
MTYDEIRPIFEKHFNFIMAFQEKGEKELKEEASKQSKMESETSKKKAAKKQKLDEEVEELKTHLQIVPNDEDDVYTEATHLALKVPGNRYSRMEKIRKDKVIRSGKVKSQNPRSTKVNPEEVKVNPGNVKVNPDKAKAEKWRKYNLRG